MRDPYKAPDSDIQIKEEIPKTWWKVFFWFLLGLEILSISFGLMEDSKSLIGLGLEISIYSLVLLGVFGYAFNRRFLNQLLWRPVIPVVAVYDVYYIFFDEPWAFESSEEMYFVIALFVLIFVPLIACQYIALFRYAFRADEIWK